MDPTPISKINSHVPKWVLGLITLNFLLLVILYIISYLVLSQQITDLRNQINKNLSSSSSSISSISSNSSITSQKSIDVTVYYYKGPFTQADTTPGTLELVPVVITNSDNSDVYFFAMNQLVNGITQQDTMNGLRTSVVFKGESTCQNADYAIKKTVNKDSLQVQLCRELDYSVQNPDGGSYSGISLIMASNVREEIKKTLKFGGITQVEVRDINGQCLAAEVQDSDCINN